MKIINGSKYEQIKKTLANTEGNCPCIPRYLWNDNTKCMCKEFREQTTTGECLCGMYEKVEGENNE